MSYESTIPKGRGGRGAAILQALEQIQRLPGQVANASSSKGPGTLVNGSSSNGPGTVVNGSSSNGPGTVVNGSSSNAPGTVNGSNLINGSSVPRKPMGRGRFLQEALKSSQENGLTDRKYNPMRPMGRGALFNIPQIKNHNYPNSDYDSIVEEKKDTNQPESLSKNKNVDEKEKADIDQITNNIMKIKQRDTINKLGTSGEEVPLTANYISLAVAPGQAVYIYDIRFSPQIDSKDLRFRIIKRQAEIFGQYRSFDGALMFIPHELKSKQLVVDVDHPVDQSRIKMLIKFIGQKQVQDCPNILNILFKKIMLSLQMVRFGRYLYDPSLASEIPQYRLEVWPGLITSVAILDGGIQICCDATHRVLRTQTVYELIKELNVTNPRDFKSECSKKLLGSSVLTRYNNKLYRVDDILWDTSPKGSFKMNDNKEITFVEYYLKNYNIQIIDENQPLLISKYKSTNKSQEIMLCLIPELCHMTGLSQDMREDFHLMKNLATYTHLTPQQRLYSFKKFFDQVRATPACVDLLKGWGLSLMPDTVRIMARQLKQEQIILGDDQVIAVKNAEWNINRRIYSAIDFKEWIILHIHKDHNVATQFMNHISKIAPHFGIKLNTPKIITIANEKIESYVKALKNALTPTVQIVVVITPSNRGDRYSAIKKICCVEHPIPSQVIMSRSLQTKLAIVTPKILFQMNCKLGGSSWGVQIPYKKVMVCGIDTYHSADLRSSSVGAFVSSLNSECTRWSSQVDFQGAKIEFLNSLSSFMTVALAEYYKVNNFLPDRVIIYRDGVGQGQLNMCKEYEIPQIYQGMKLYLEDYCPQLTYIVCQKRINTRFYLNMRGTLDNPQPGTVVDNTVTNPDLFDFYLISQKVRKGTVTPTHYVVVHNKSTMTPDQVQKFTYKMTYLYYNWNGTVRVPASCQYAHKLAQLVGQYLKVKPSKKLMDKLYYL